MNILQDNPSFHSSPVVEDEEIESYMVSETFPDLTRIINTGGPTEQKKAIDRLTSCIYEVGAVDLREDDLLYRPNELTNIFCNLSDESQEALCTIAEAYIKFSKVEQQELLDYIRRHSGNVANQVSTGMEKNVREDMAYGQSTRRKQRARGQNTVRKTYTLSEVVAEAIQNVAQSKHMGASLYIEEVMMQQSEVKKSLDI